MNGLDCFGRRTPLTARRGICEDAPVHIIAPGLIGFYSFYLAVSCE
jgi:hypothetical protein